MPVHAVTHASTAAASARSEVAQKAHAHKFAGALAHASSKSAADTPDRILDLKRAPKSEKSTPVEGHAYADITSGPRNGMYLNTSGNKRDGREYHIYGSGKDRLVVCLPRKKDADDDTASKVKSDPRSTAPARTTGSS